jgi:hypothetical protein
MLVAALRLFVGIVAVNRWLYFCIISSFARFTLAAVAAQWAK